MMLTVDRCCRLLRLEFFDAGIEIGRPVVRTAHSFDMSTIAKAATIVETSLPDQVANMVHSTWSDDQVLMITSQRL